MQVLVDTKKEYTKYIQDSIAISIAEKINNYYDDSVKQGLGMKGFQNNLNNIKKWDNNILEIEYNNLLAKSKYKNLEKIYNFTINTLNFISDKFYTIFLHFNKTFLFRLNTL